LATGRARTSTIQTRGHFMATRQSVVRWAVVLVAAALLAVPGFSSGASNSQTTGNLTLDLGGGATVKLVLIPAGKFMMGSPATEKDRDKDEVQHEVTISKPFHMGITPVTVDQFAAFVKDSGYKTDVEKAGWSLGVEIKDGTLMPKKADGCSWRNPSFDQKGDHPVVQVSWDDARAFCDWLSKKSGKTVVLPTESQWEYACRAGSKTAYLWGDNPDDGKGWANCADQSLKKKLPNAPAAWTFFSWDDGFVFTSPVANFKANAFGLYDMTGNVWQWCGDGYGDYPGGAVTDPVGPAPGPFRVQRGGSWIDTPGYCRSAGRSSGAPLNRDGHGFRVVVSVSAPGL
jgi:sulfatase modifying factor 1